MKCDLLLVTTVPLEHEWVSLYEQEMSWTHIQHNIYVSLFVLPIKTTLNDKCIVEKSKTSFMIWMPLSIFPISKLLVVFAPKSYAENNPTLA